MNNPHNPTNFNARLREFIQSLQALFPEDTNIELTKLLLDKYGGDGIWSAFKTELTPEVYEQLRSRDERIIHDSALMRKLMQFSLIDFNALWTKLTAENKLVVWSWLNVLAAVARD